MNFLRKRKSGSRERKRSFEDLIEQFEYDFDLNPKAHNMPPPSPTGANDMGYYMHLLKRDDYANFEKLVLSRLTRNLDFPGALLDGLRGEVAEEPPTREDVDFIELNASTLRSFSKLFEHLKKNVHIKGIFRQSGNAIRMKRLTELLRNEEPIDFDEFRAHDSAGVLKQMLNRLPEPLLMPSKYMEAHRQIAALRGGEIENLQLLLILLPSSHCFILKDLMQLLSLIDSHSDVNMMTAQNLATVLAPTILLPRTDGKGEGLDISVLTRHLAFMIRHHRIVFDCPRDMAEIARQFTTAKDRSKSSLSGGDDKLAMPSSAVKRTRSKCEADARAFTQKSLGDLYHATQQYPDEKRRKLLRGFKNHFDVVTKYGEGGSSGGRARRKMASSSIDSQLCAPFSTSNKWRRKSDEP